MEKLMFHEKYWIVTIERNCVRRLEWEFLLQIKSNILWDAYFIKAGVYEELINMSNYYILHVELWF